MFGLSNNIIDDISKAIASRSFSSLYNEVNVHVDLTCPEDKQPIVTPSKKSGQHLDNDLINQSLNGTCINSSPDSTKTQTHSLVENHSYYLNTPLLKEMKDKSFNDTFIDFFSELKKQDKKEKLEWSCLRSVLQVMMMCTIHTT